ncbi:MAG TPA: hypothetical protein VL172_12265, partial [Kofleriaceae bacterium]|nr:hypothetical protein [Kofleriaceae bacterium]
LEEEFFRREEASKLAAYADNKEREPLRKELAAASGMTDTAVLDKLIDCGITAKTMTAVSLVPLVAVAWADGKIQDNERNAILQSAKGKGIEEGGPAYEMLSAWLARKPGTELIRAWEAYIEALDAKLTGEQIKILKRQVMDRARDVAGAAGGFLGVGRVSSDEEKVLERLESVFDRRSASVPSAGDAAD